MPRIYKKTIAPAKGAGGPAGEVVAVIATIGVIDSDGDVVTETTFQDGWQCPVSHWGHNHAEQPLGMARIEVHKSARQVRARCRIFVETDAGLNAMRALMGMGERQEWSWALDVIKSHRGQIDGRSARFLDKIKLYEVCPVIAGASVGSRTISAKHLSTTGVGSVLHASPKYAVFKARLAFLAELDERASKWRKQASLDETAPLTNLDQIRMAVARRWDGMPDYFQSAQVQAEIDTLIERDVRRQEQTAGVLPNRVEATERVLRWARSPARL
jgi:hypothetical protein